MTFGIRQLQRSAALLSAARSPSGGELAELREKVARFVRDAEAPGDSTAVCNTGGEG